MQRREEVRTTIGKKNSVTIYKYIIVVVASFQSTFHLKIYQNNFFIF
jgi:hypothetical protein